MNEWHLIEYEYINVYSENTSLNVDAIKYEA